MTDGYLLNLRTFREVRDDKAQALKPLNGAAYRIDYILDDFEGLAQKYVALAISKEDE